MGQQNEIEEPEFILDQLNSYEEQIKKDDIFSEDSFQIAKNIAKEYITYKDILDKNQKKKQYKNDQIDISEDYDRNKLEEIKNKFDRINKWIKMAKTPYRNNFQHFLNKITGEDKKVKNNNLFKDKSTDNIFGRGFKRKNNKLNNNILGQNFPETERKDKNKEIIKKGKKEKRTTSLDKYKSKEFDSDQKNQQRKNFENYNDKNIEDKILSFYNHNKSKYKERLFKGPPECFRWLSWIIANQIPLERDINIYNNYLVKDLEEENKNSIIRDIQRTFSDVNMDEMALRKKETSLYNVLKAFWNLDEQIGYCQGMNLVVGFMLIISEGNELDTFYMLISNFSETFNKRKTYEYSFRGLFSEEFPLLSFLNFIFDILLEENIPEIKNHLEELGISYDLWIGQWFQTLFTIILPLNMCKRVWDCIFSDNIYFLVKFGIAFTKLIKTEILDKTEEIDVINFFKELQKFSMYPDNKFLESKCDIDTLITKASKIKLDPEEYIKLYRRRNENYGEFKSMMDKNSKISYNLEIGNISWNDYNLNCRKTVLFEKDNNEKEKDTANLDQIKELYGKDFKKNENIIENEKKQNNKIDIEPKIKQNDIKINENQINKEDKNEIKIKPILQRKNNINTNKKLFIPKQEIFDFEKNNNNMDKIFNENKGEKTNNKINRSNNLNPTYKKKKMNQMPFNKDKNINKIKNNYDNNINYDYNNIDNDNNKNMNNNEIKINTNDNNNNNFNMINKKMINNEFDYNISNNFNNIYNDKLNKYYNVNLAKDNKNLDRYYFKNNQIKKGK